MSRIHKKELEEMALYTVYYQAPFCDWQKDITTNDQKKAKERAKFIGLKGFITKIKED